MRCACRLERGYMNVQTVWRALPRARVRREVGKALHVRKVAVDVVGDRIRDGASSVERPDEVEAAAEQELCELGPRAVAASMTTTPSATSSSDCSTSYSAPSTSTNARSIRCSRTPRYAPSSPTRRDGAAGWAVAQLLGLPLARRRVVVAGGGAATIDSTDEVLPSCDCVKFTVVKSAHAAVRVDGARPARISRSNCAAAPR